jgi:hypothetical protein
VIDVGTPATIRSDYLQIINGFYFKQLATTVMPLPTQKFALGSVFCGVGNASFVSDVTNFSVF